MAEYRINDWDNFKFPILSLDNLDLKEIIYNTKSKIKNKEPFSDRELVELAVTPILPKGKENIINQFFETADLISEIDFANNEIKNSVCGLVLMLTNIYFDKLEEVRKKIQGVYMVKVDCVVEYGQDKYNEGVHDSSIELAGRLLAEGIFSIEKISEIVNLPVEEIEEIKQGM